MQKTLSRLKDALASGADRSRPSGRDVTLVAIVKNERDYLLEWLAYHRSVGFRSFIIGDNDSDDGTSELLEALDDCGVIERRHAPDIPGAPTQIAFYNSVVDALRPGPDRLLGFIDADEFVMAARSFGVADRVAAAFRDPEVAALGLNWKTYGSSGHLREGVGPVLLRFNGHADRAFEKNRFIKSFARLSRIRRMDVHNAVLDSGRYVNGSGAPLELERAGWRHRTRDVDWSNLFVAHYAVKSRHEHERKKARKGSATRGAGALKGAAYFASHDRNERYRTQPARLLRSVFAEQQALLLRMRTASLYFLPCTGAVTVDRSGGVLSGWVAFSGPVPSRLRVIARSAGREQVAATIPFEAASSGRGRSRARRYGFRVPMTGFDGCRVEDLELRPYGSCVRLPVAPETGSPA